LLEDIEMINGDAESAAQRAGEKLRTGLGTLLKPDLPGFKLRC
jgi:hypothetical protein